MIYIFYLRFDFLCKAIPPDYFKLRIIFLTLFEARGSKENAEIKIEDNKNCVENIFSVLFMKYIVSIVPGIIPTKVAKIKGINPTLESPAATFISS